MVNRFIRRSLELVEDTWEKNHFLISLLLAVCTGIAHFFDLINQFREVLGNVIAYASMLLAVIGVFLTLFITLQNSDLFVRLRSLFPESNIKMIKYMRQQFMFGIALVVISILISILPSAGKVDSIGIGIWGYFFWDLSIGSCYIIKLLCDLLIKDQTPIPKLKKRE